MAGVPVEEFCRSSPELWGNDKNQVEYDCDDGSRRSHDR